MKVYVKLRVANRMVSLTAMLVRRAVHARSIFDNGTSTQQCS